MSNEKMKRMTLSGAIRGSASLREQDGRTRVSLSLMGGAGDLLLAAYGSGGVTLIRLDGREAELSRDGICAIALFSCGRMVSQGFTGECRGLRSRILDEMRIRAAEGGAPAPRKDSPAKEERGQELPAASPFSMEITRGNSPASSAAAGIIEQARRLFGALDKMAIQPEEPKMTQTNRNEEFEQVTNPFPRTFPGSAWKKRPGEERLYGEVKIKGRLHEAEAYPVDMKERRTRSADARLLISKDGRRYRIEIDRREGETKNIF